MKRINKILKVFLLVHVIALTLTGCFQKQKVVAEVRDEQVTESFYNIFLWETQRGLESVEPNVWKLDNIKGKSPVEHAKERALAAISYDFAVKEKADELGVKLNKEDKDYVKRCVDEAWKNNEAINSKYDIQKKDYEAYYTYIRLGEKVVNVMGENYEPSEEEIAEVISSMEKSNALPKRATIIQVFVKTTDEQGNVYPNDKKEEAYKKAQAVLEKALNGEELSSLVDSYSDDTGGNGDLPGEYHFVQGTMDKALEKVVFEEAKLGQVYPQVIETEKGYEIVKVIDVQMADENTIRETAVKKIGKSFAQSELIEMSNLFEIQTKPSFEEIGLIKADEEEAINN